MSTMFRATCVVQPSGHSRVNPALPRAELIWLRFVKEMLILVKIPKFMKDSDKIRY